VCLRATDGDVPSRHTNGLLISMHERSIKSPATSSFDVTGLLMER